MTKEYYNAFNPEESITGNHAGNCFQIEIHTGESTHSIELSLVDAIRMISAWEVDIENSLEARLCRTPPITQSVKKDDNRRAYMRKYMAEKRARERNAKATNSNVSVTLQPDIAEA